MLRCNDDASQHKEISREHYGRALLVDLPFSKYQTPYDRNSEVIGSNHEINEDIFFEMIRQGWLTENFIWGGLTWE